MGIRLHIRHNHYYFHYIFPRPYDRYTSSGLPLEAVFAGCGALSLFGDALFFNVSHTCMSFSSVLSFLLSRHSVDCSVPL